MTTQQSLISTIDNANEILKQADRFISTLNEKENYQSEIKETNEWLNIILNDVKNGIAHNSFYDIINNLVSTFNVYGLQMLDKAPFPSGHMPEPKYILDEFVKAREDREKAMKAYSFYKALGFANQNTVLVGANGCGKTSLANVLSTTLQQKDGIVIPAQKLLIIPSFNNIPNRAAAENSYNSFQKNIPDDKKTYNVSTDNDLPYGIVKEFSEGYKLILSKLLSELASTSKIARDKLKRRDTIDEKAINCKIDEAIYIWNFLIEDKALECNDNYELIIREKEVSYPAYKMSDGERIILYLAGRVLLAPHNALIVVDEPELHLHKTIANKLWDTLENKRNDCTFYYFTHDLDFAISRNAKKCWIQSYKYPRTWDIKPIEKNDIPDNLLLKLLGSKKKILFCEGISTSYDKQIFEIIFSNYTITPVGSCKNVINYTKAFNALKNKNAIAYGMIDRDFHTQQELDTLKKDNIFSHGVAEIENLFLTEGFLQAFDNATFNTNEIGSIKDKIISQLDSMKQEQASFYVTSKIEYYFKEEHFTKGKSESELNTNFNSFVNKIKIREWYNDRMDELNKIVKQKDYKSTIMIYNNKGLHNYVEQNFGIKDYHDKALAILKNNKNAQKVLKQELPKELFEIK